MPITITQALDLIMVLVLVMFIPIGLWRGALREWITCIGAVFGLLLADAAGTRWGDGFARLSNMDPQLAGFTVATGFFLATTLLIGYGGGITIPYRADLSWTNRGIGAALSFGNGFLILGGLLHLMQGRLFDGRGNSPLHTATLAAFLIDSSVAWIYLGLFIILLLCVILGLARRLNDGSSLFEEYSPIYQVTSQGDWTSAAHWQPQVTPPEDWATETPRSGMPVGQQETAVIKILPTAAQIVESSTASTSTIPPASTTPTAPNVSILARPNIHPLTPDKRESDKDERTTLQIDSRGDGAPTQIPRPTPAVAPPPTNGESGPEPQRTNCGGCGAVIAGNARFCLNCGHVVGTAERRRITR